MNGWSTAVRILLVRHGETDWNRTHRFQGRSDIPLNQVGKRQAHALALRLKDENLTAVYSSPLKRALETARMIKNFHASVPLCIEEGLVEMDIGEFDGMEAHQWAAQYPDFLKMWRADPSNLTMPGGESLHQVQTRAVDVIDRISSSHSPGSTVLVSGHNFVNLTLLCHALQVPLARFREVKQGTAALNVLLQDGNRLVAQVVNDRAHLEAHEIDPEEERE